MSYVKQLLPLPEGTEKDSIVWEEANDFHRKSYHQRYYLCLRKAVLPVLRERGYPITVVDTPCASGIGTAYINEQIHGNKVIGIDINEQAIKMAKERYPGPTYLCGDMSEMLKGLRFDVALCLEFLEHVEADYADHIVEMIHKNLAPGGIAVFTSPRLRPRETYVGRSHHIHEYYDEEFYYSIEKHFPFVERYSMDRYANTTHYSKDANLMVAVAHKWYDTKVFIH